MKLLLEQFPAALLLDPNISLTTQFSNTHSVYSSPHMKDQVLHRTQNEKQNYCPLCTTCYYYLQVVTRTKKYSEPNGILPCLM